MGNESSEGQFDIGSLLEKAAAAYGEDNYLLAEQLYDKALQCLDANDTASSAELIQCLQSLAEIYYRSQRLTEALPIYQRLLEQSELALGANHLDVIATTFRLAQTYEGLKMPRKAEEMFQHATNAAERALGLAHPASQKIRDAYFAFLAEQKASDEQDIDVSFLATSTRISDLKQSGTDTSPDLSDYQSQTGQKRSAKKGGNYRPPTKIKTLRYGAESALERASTVLGFRYLWRHWRGAVVSIPLLLALFFFTALVLTQLKSRTVAVNKERVAEMLVKKKKFASADNIVGLTFVDTRHVLLSGDVHHRPIPFIILRGGPEDVGTIIASAFTRRENWYQCKRDVLNSETGTVLYPNDAPENFIAAKMHLLEEFAQTYYRRTGCYPNESKKWQNSGSEKSSGLVYINPFTDKPDFPTLRILNGNLDPNYLFHEMDTSDYKTDPFAFLLHGGVWRDEQIPQPGRINALALFLAERCADGFKVTDFYIRGYDRESKPLTAGSPGTLFIIGLKEGKKLNQDNRDLNAETVSNSIYPPDRICIVEGDDVDLTMMRQSVQTILEFAMAISLFVWIYAEFKKRKAQPSRLPQTFEVIFALSAVLLLVSVIIHKLP
jgi:tetratricopeptide (TPR) repeat protein